MPKRNTESPTRYREIQLIRYHSRLPCGILFLCTVDAYSVLCVVTILDYPHLRPFENDPALFASVLFHQEHPQTN